MNTSFEGILDQLKKSLNSQPLKKIILKFTKVGKVLDQSSDYPSFPFDFIQAFLSSFSFLKDALSNLIHPSDDRAFFLSTVEAAQILQTNDMLSFENFNNMIEHNDAGLLVQMVINLHRMALLNPGNFQTLTYHHNLFELNQSIQILTQAAIFTQSNFDALSQEANIGILNLVMSYLRQAHFLNQESLSALLAPEHSGLLTQEAYQQFWSRVPEGRIEQNWDRILTATRDAEPLEALIMLRDEMINPIRFIPYEEIIGIQPPILNIYPYNFQRNLEDFQRDLEDLHRNINARFLERPATQQHILIQETLLNRIIRDPFRFEEIIIDNDIFHNFNAEAENFRPTPYFNQAQSTHTASVHRSVSESANSLMDCYGEHLDIETAIENIITFVNSLDSSFTHDAAKRCIARIAAPDYTFTDSSGVSTRQLLALAFTAIHDDTKRQGTLEDALTLFVEGLYEIQRGYNLNEDGIDDESPDDGNICVAGTFNKIMEKLNGIHPDVEVYFITHEGAYVKFPQVVKEHTLTYLNHLACPETATDYLAIKELLDSMQDNGLEPIWDKIKADVEAELWSEFREAYANNLNHQLFREMIDNGLYSNATDLTGLYSTLEASPGYQAFLYQLEQRSLKEQRLFLGLQQHSLWANRHENANAQHAFDRRYGLAIVNSKNLFGH